MTCQVYRLFCLVFPLTPQAGTRGGRTRWWGPQTALSRGRARGRRR